LDRRIVWLLTPFRSGSCRLDRKRPSPSTRSFRSGKTVKIIQVPLTENDALLLQVVLGRSDFREFFSSKDHAAPFDKLYVALTKAINDSW
jgi:hypothetical protein